MSDINSFLQIVFFSYLKQWIMVARLNLQRLKILIQ